MTDIVVRAPLIDLDRDHVAPEWVCGNPFQTQVFNALSMMFPVGERYFIDCVRQALPDLNDPALIDDVRHFTGQEGMHARLHETLNKQLDAQGLRNVILPLILWRVKQSQRFSLRSRLAISAAYEHFTASLGDLLLQHPEWLDDAPDYMRVLWTWHAIEETEHRAVVYDVYLKNGGSYAHRIAWYLYVSVIFTLESMVQTLVNLKNSGNLFSLSCWRKGLPFLFGQRGIFLNLLRPWLAYLTPGYYPDDRHSAPKRVEWLERHKQWFKA